LLGLGESGSTNTFLQMKNKKKWNERLRSNFTSVVVTLSLHITE
jgi:hypothetical protein